MKMKYTAAECQNHTRYIRILTQMVGFLVFGSLTLANVGCRSTESVTNQKAEAWEVETFKREVESHQNVVLVHIYENRLQRMSLPNKHHLDSKGTIVRSYKGTWQAGEPIAFSRELESVPRDWKPSVGHSVYLFLDRHTRDPIGIDTGENWTYKPEFERALQSTR